MAHTPRWGVFSSVISAARKPGAESLSASDVWCGKVLPVCGVSRGQVSGPGIAAAVEAPLSTRRIHKRVQRGWSSGPRFLSVRMFSGASMVNGAGAYPTLRLAPAERRHSRRFAIPVAAPRSCPVAQFRRRSPARTEPVTPRPGSQAAAEISAVKASRSCGGGGAAQGRDRYRYAVRKVRVISNGSTATPRRVDRQARASTAPSDARC